MGVSENSGTPKSSILIRFSIVNHPFWGTPIFGNTHIYNYILYFICLMEFLVSLPNPSGCKKTQENVNQLGELRGRRIISSMCMCLVKPMSSDPLCEDDLRVTLGLCGRVHPGRLT